MASHPVLLCTVQSEAEVTLLCDGLAETGIPTVVQRSGVPGSLHSHHYTEGHYARVLVPAGQLDSAREVQRDVAVHFSQQEPRSSDARRSAASGRALHGLQEALLALAAVVALPFILLWDALRRR